MCARALVDDYMVLTPNLFHNKGIFGTTHFYKQTGSQEPTLPKKGVYNCMTKLLELKV